MNRIAHHQRLITGLILVAVLGLALAFGGWALRLLVLSASLLGLYEFYSFYWPGKSGIGYKICGLLCGAGAVIGQAFSPFWVILSPAVAFCISALAFLGSYGRGNDQARLQDYAPLALGVIYIPLVLQLALYLSLEEQILIMAAAIATDTGGYYAGTLFGKHKIWPRVSPKKSWEGAAGGMAACCAVCVLAGGLSLMKGWSLPALPLWLWLGAGVLLNLAAQFGDFFESALKRTVDVKDSSSLLPGHGGLLDRVDSVLFVLPTYMLIRTAALAWAGTAPI